MPVDPANLEDVAAALLRECTTQVPGARLAGALTPVTGGFDTYIYFFGLAGDVPPEWSGPLVLRLYPGPEREDSARRETAIQAFCADAGYPAPRPLTCGDNASSFGLSFMIMERAPGRTILAALSAQPWRAGALLDQLAGLQARLHALDPAGFPVAPVGPLVDRMLDLMDQEFSPVDKNIEGGVAWLRARRAIVADETGTVAICHNDFHPLNTLVDADGHATVLDWADAQVGDRHCDVARSVVIFSIAPLAASSTVERVALHASKGWLARRYRRAYENARPLDAARLQYWMALHALFGCGQVASLHAGRNDSETRQDNIDRVSPDLAAGLRANFEKLRARIP